MIRNPLISTVAHRMLKALQEGDDTYALVEGSQVWVDFTQFSYCTFLQLLRLCLISQEPSSNGSKTEIWYLNEEGRRVIDDPAYVPMILIALQKARG